MWRFEDACQVSALEWAGGCLPAYLHALGPSHPPLIDRSRTPLHIARPRFYLLGRALEGPLPGLVCRDRRDGHARRQREGEEGRGRAEEARHYFVGFWVWGERVALLCVGWVDGGMGRSIDWSSRSIGLDCCAVLGRRRRLRLASVMWSGWASL